jgi:hypothetical protein
MDDSLDQSWTSYASDLKADVPRNDSDDPYYRAKFDGNGDVVNGWDYHSWVLSRVADIKPFGSKNCATVTDPRQTR